MQIGTPPKSNYKQSVLGFVHLQATFMNYSLQSSVSVPTVMICTTTKSSFPLFSPHIFPLQFVFHRFLHFSLPPSSPFTWALFSLLQCLNHPPLTWFLSLLTRNYPQNTQNIFPQLLSSVAVFLWFDDSKLQTAGRSCIPSPCSHSPEQLRATPSTAPTCTPALMAKDKNTVTKMAAETRPQEK